MMPGSKDGSRVVVVAEFQILEVKPCMVLVVLSLVESMCLRLQMAWSRMDEARSCDCKWCVPASAENAATKRVCVFKRYYDLFMVCC